MPLFTLIPIAVIAGGTALMVYVIRKARKRDANFVKRADEL